MVQGDASVFQAWLVCHPGADIAEYIPQTVGLSLLELKHGV